MALRYLLLTVNLTLSYPFLLLSDTLVFALATSVHLDLLCPLNCLYCTIKGTVCLLANVPKLVQDICILFGTNAIDNPIGLVYT